DKCRRRHLISAINRYAYPSQCSRSLRVDQISAASNVVFEANSTRSPGPTRSSVPGGRIGRTGATYEEEGTRLTSWLAETLSRSRTPYPAPPAAPPEEP